MNFRPIKQKLRSAKRMLGTRLRAINPIRQQREIDTLYTLLYKLTHDLENALDLSATQTQEAFASQWTNLKAGNYLLTDPWFKENVDRILSEEEIQIKPEWFKGKEILDVGCGNGRWSYGFAKLGANITAVDINQVAVQEARQAVAHFNVNKDFYISAVEELSHTIPLKQYDLVFSWGVLHHCRSFNQALAEIIKFVKPDGILYLYLYGRESLPYTSDIELFKERIRYNSLLTEADKYEFLLKKAGNDPQAVHNYHDIFAPIINRRLEFDHVKHLLEEQGFADITRTIAYTELFVRAIKGHAAEYYEQWILPKKSPPYWFQHH